MSYVEFENERDYEIAYMHWLTLMNWTDFLAMEEYVEERTTQVMREKLMWFKPIYEQHSEPCVWEEIGEHSVYITGCGNRFEIIEGIPRENGMKYCPYCGDKITVKT